MKKFDIGTEVVFLESEVAKQENIVGKKGIVTEFDGKSYPYYVKYSEKLEKGGWFYAHELTENIQKEVLKTVQHDGHKVIYNEPATIVILSTGEKGVAKCLSTDTYDREKGYQIALLRAQTKAKEKEVRKAQKEQRKRTNDIIAMNLRLEELCK